jgi:NAD(P)-dependent dehydrogenase (short-subunit alcohol dehydrogenase family)
MTVSAAVELGPRGITVNAIDPGPTDTGWMSPELFDAVERATPLGRPGRTSRSSRISLLRARRLPGGSCDLTVVTRGSAFRGAGES